MFKKVSGVNYVIEKNLADTIYKETKEHLDKYLGGSKISIGVLSNTLKEIISYRVAVLADGNMKNEILPSGFITVIFDSDIGFNISIGYAEDELVYGVLVH